MLQSPSYLRAGQAQQQSVAAALRAWADWATQRSAALQRLNAVHEHWAIAVQRAALDGWRDRAAWLVQKRAASLHMVQVW